jgi:antitoxin YefM
MEATYTETRAKLAKYWNRVVDTRETLTVRRRGSEPIAILPASELRSLQETAYLLRSPRNAKRLLEALQQSLEQEGEPETPAELKASLGLE